MPFTCTHSPMIFDDSRWIAHDPEGNFAGEFPCEQDARAAVDRWNDNNGDAVKVEWTAPPEGADDSDRGRYTVTLSGTKWRRVASRGWYSMEASARIAASLRNAIAKHGLQEVREILAAVER